MGYWTAEVLNTTHTKMDGTNTFLFEGSATDHTPTIAKLDLYLDLTPPEIHISDPPPQYLTNQPTVTITGSLSDTYDASPSLTRNGTAIPLSGGRLVTLTCHSRPVKTPSPTPLAIASATRTPTASRSSTKPRPPCKP